MKKWIVWLCSLMLLITGSFALSGCTEAEPTGLDKLLTPELKAKIFEVWGDVLEADDYQTFKKIPYEKGIPEYRITRSWLNGFFEAETPEDAQAFLFQLAKDLKLSVEDLQTQNLFTIKENVILPGMMDLGDAVKGEDGYYSADGKTLYRYTGTDAEYTPPETVTVLGSCSLAYSSTLKRVTIPDYIESVGGSLCLESAVESVTFSGECSLKCLPLNAFSCTPLSSIEIPSSIEFIAPHCFYRCADLESISFAENSSLERIGVYAFGYSGLTGLRLPDGVRELGDRLLADCANLNLLTLPVSIQSIGASLFTDLPDEVLYAGTAEQWALVQLGENNDWTPIFARE